MEKNANSIWEDDLWKEHIETKPRKIKRCTDKPKKSAKETNIHSDKVTNNNTVKKRRDIWEEDFWNEHIEKKPRKIIENTDKPKKNTEEVNIIADEDRNNETVKKRRDIDQLDNTSFAPAVHKKKYQKIQNDNNDTERKGGSFKNWFPYQNAQVAKMFNGTIHYGVITAYSYEKDEKYMSDEGYPMIWYWHVRYEDGDEEDLNLKELYDALNLFQSSPRKRSKKLPEILLEPSKTECSESEHDSNENYYDVKMILDRRTIRRHGGIEGIQYLVKWKDTWINAERLPPNLLQKAFKKFDVINDVDAMEITAHDNESNSSLENHRESEDSLETHSNRILNESDYDDHGGKLWQIKQTSPQSLYSNIIFLLQVALS